MSRTTKRIITITLGTLVALLALGAATWTLAPQLIATAASTITGEDTTATDGLKTGTAPETTTLTDENGTPIAYFYDQNRTIINSNDIADTMKNAVVAIEDRRYYHHNGMDMYGSIRAMVANITGGAISQGASTLEQQYVKNYHLYVEADGDEEKAAAVEQSYTRKLREIALAQDLSRSERKDDILAHYLNIVYYGNGAYGVEAAAHTYFDTTAKDLTIPQAALLAGIVQAPSRFDPYTNPEETTQRRNDVLHALAAYGTISEGEATALTDTPLGVIDAPLTPPQGCAEAGDAGYFCDYVRTWLEDHGHTDITRGGYTITTTLNPDLQQRATNALGTVTDPDQSAGTTTVMDMIAPTPDKRPILAMAATTPYGLGDGATVFPHTTANVGSGAGSVFKIFTAATALDKGIGTDTELDVPKRYEANNLGEGGAEDCPPGKYCVENAGTYPEKLPLWKALALSPNTPFIQLSEAVGIQSIINMSMKLGLRSYEGTQLENTKLGSYTLGPTAVSALELSNVGATIAAGGQWCEPTPINHITAHGADVDVPTPPCEQILNTNVAHALSGALASDVTEGTAQPAATTAGWEGQLSAKTGTTEDYSSAAFLGFNTAVSAAVYTYNTDTPAPLCSHPIRQCAEGNLYGGMDPADVFFTALTGSMAATGTVPPIPEGFHTGDTINKIQSIIGTDATKGMKQLSDWGFHPTLKEVDNPTKGTILTVHGGIPVQGAELVVETGNGTTPPPPEPKPEPSTTRTPVPTPRLTPTEPTDDGPIVIPHRPPTVDEFLDGIFG